MDNKMYCTLIRQSIYYITISCSFLCLRGKIIMGQLVKSRVTWESDHICVLITRRSQSWKSFYDFLDLCSHLILLNIFDESTWLTCENNLKKKKNSIWKCPWRRHWMWKCCQRGVSWAKERENRANTKKQDCFFLANIQKEFICSSMCIWGIN